MASDEEDDELEALRQAALATLKKRPVSAELEDAQPIPQITGSGHSLAGPGAQWAEDFPANLSQSPFGSNQPVSAFQDGVWNQPFHPSKFHQTSPKRFGQNNWRVGRGLYPKQTPRGRGVSLRRGQPFHPKGAAFPHAPRLPFVQSAPAPNRGSNLIVINTVPEDEGGAARECTEVAPLAPQRAGPRAGTSVNAGKSSSTILPLENSSKPFLIRPQDKYCSTSDRAIGVQESTTTRKKKKDKFSRFDSSGSDSDDESESDDEESARDEDVSSQSCSPSAADIILDESKDTSSSLEESGTNVLDIVEPRLSVTVASETQSDNVPEMDVSPSGGRRCDSDTDEDEEEKLLLSPITESVKSPELHQSAAAVPADVDADDDKNKSPLPFVRDLEPCDECASAASKQEEVKSDHDNNSRSAEESSSLSDEEADSESGSAATGSESVASGSESISELSDEGDSDGDDQDSSVSEEQTSESSSSSESEKEIERQKTVKRPADIGVKVAVSQSNTLATKKKERESDLSPVERAKLEARKRKFANREEVHVSPNKTISLKGIVAKPKGGRMAGEVEHAKSLTVVKAAQPETRKANQELSQKSFADAHRKHSRRKILIDPKMDGSSPQDDARDVKDTDEDEDDEDKRDRSWKREANSKTVWHKSSRSLNHTLPNDNFARSEGHSFRDNARREFGRNGSQRRAYDSRNRQAGVRTYYHGSPPGGHYCSSDEEKDESGRKLISVVVSRSTTSQQSQNAGQNPVTSQERTFKGPRRPIVPRKREASSGASVVNPGNNGDGRLVLHSKLFPGSDSLTYKESGTTGIVSSEDAPLEKRSRVKADRKPVHQRLGWKDVAGRSSRSTVHSHKRNETNSDSALQAVPSQHCHHPHGVF